MDKPQYEEMLAYLNTFEQIGLFQRKEIYLFGHSNATETLVDLLHDRGYVVSGILDNNSSKQGDSYKEVMIFLPEEILHGKQSKKIECIAARAYEAMV